MELNVIHYIKNYKLIKIKQNIIVKKKKEQYKSKNKLNR